MQIKLSEWKEVFRESHQDGGRLVVLLAWARLGPVEWICSDLCAGSGCVPRCGMTKTWEVLSVQRRIRLSHERNLDYFVDWE